ncbi:3-hydroxyacyl-CoA dehydrogenase family protein [Geodermatophilus sabuli]|uniref:3-hydroxyacyl-CoA dehydrogenase family protein n=1 Tax=Geodermatophilus sabuli TaxID=1564158 RepID=A0A7K3VVN6_9ACTN|nr:3-hydroxyacyl-CoA dehydrogenase family protein [Geodermatophilus sabuli]NEK56695.1 3-hydroxyacyl-CoA dehydrogenase family protein [Geodermatophilus sabuli]
MGYVLPEDVDRRPVAVVGAGTLGRRIAAVLAAGGTDVRITDTSAEQRESAREHAVAAIEDVHRAMGMDSTGRGTVAAVAELEEALAGAWLVVEAVPERLDVKTAVFGRLDRLAEPDAVLASNSSSIPTSQVIGEVTRPERVLNTHFQSPPEHNAVELMSCGRTDPAVVDALMAWLPRYGLVPFRVRRESDGFIFNRIWAAIKRECLMVVEEGVAAPEDVDLMWQLFTRPGTPPFRLMDVVGLDVVLAIEEHYAAVREGIPEGPRRLLREHIDQGRLGRKSGSGFYDDYG